jgi:transposase-like protein
LPQEAAHQREDRCCRFGGAKETMNKTERNGAGVPPRRTYDETYKRHAVALTLRGDRTVKAVAAELGIAAWALYESCGSFRPSFAHAARPTPIIT